MDKLQYESESSEDERKPESKSRLRLKGQDTQRDEDVVSDDDDKKTAKKKIKLEINVSDETMNMKEDEKILSSVALPKPELYDSTSSSTYFENLIKFEENYTETIRDKPKVAKIAPQSANEMSFLSTQSSLENQNEKLLEKYQKYCSVREKSSEKEKTENFASHLQSQKSFWNPDMFPSIISHFGIDAPETNMPSTTWNPGGFQSFEYAQEINASEESARLATASELATTTCSETIQTLDSGNKSDEDDKKISSSSSL